MLDTSEVRDRRFKLASSRRTFLMWPMLRQRKRGKKGKSSKSPSRRSAHFLRSLALAYVGDAVSSMSIAKGRGYSGTLHYDMRMSSSIPRCELSTFCLVLCLLERQTRGGLFEWVGCTGHAFFG